MTGIINILKFISSHPLSKDNKINAIKRFVTWQVSYRIFPYPVIFDFINGTRLIISRGMHGATGNIYTGLHEFEDMSFLLHLLKEEDLFIDVGANVGVYTILASGVKNTKTIAIEPITETFQKLVDNININKIVDKVKALNLGIGSEKKQLFFTKNFDTVNHVVYEKRNDTIQVDVFPLDELVGRNDDLRLLKIDVEGFEKEVLNGADSILKNENLKAIIIELNGSGNKYGFLDSEVDKILRTYGFKIFYYDPFKRELNKLDNINTSGNTIYIRDINFVKNRIKNAEGFIVFNYKI